MISLQIKEKKSSDYILLIMNCQKYRQKAQQQKDTWLQRLVPGLTYYHVLGDPNLDSEFIFDEEANLLVVRAPDDYNSLPKKVIAAFAAIQQTYNYKYIFKTDDDQNVEDTKIFKTLMLLLAMKKPQIHYGGHIVNIRRPQVSNYYQFHPELPNNLVLKPTQYCSGRFYLLSSVAVNQLLQRRQHIEQEYFEDYAIGYNVDPILKRSIFNIDTNKYFRDFV